MQGVPGDRQRKRDDRSGHQRHSGPVHPTDRLQVPALERPGVGKLGPARGQPGFQQLHPTRGDLPLPVLGDGQGNSLSTSGSRTASSPSRESARVCTASIPAMSCSQPACGAGPRPCRSPRQPRRRPVTGPSRPARPPAGPRLGAAPRVGPNGTSTRWLPGPHHPPSSVVSDCEPMLVTFQGTPRRLRRPSGQRGCRRRCRDPPRRRACFAGRCY